MSEDPEVLVVRSGGYMVRSASVPGAWRFVWGSECSCPAGDKPTCRHRKAVREFCRDNDLRHARPSAPANISALVD